MAPSCAWIYSKLQITIIRLGLIFLPWTDSESIGLGFGLVKYTLIKRRSALPHFSWRVLLLIFVLVWIWHLCFSLISPMGLGWIWLWFGFGLYFGLGFGMFFSYGFGLDLFLILVCFFFCFWSGLVMVMVLFSVSFLFVIGFVLVLILILVLLVEKVWILFLVFRKQVWGSLLMYIFYLNNLSLERLFRSNFKSVKKKFLQCL